MKYDYIIIGSGLGGLCTGIILAKENKKVLILEQHSKPGGYLHSFYRKGHRFETGFHFAPELDNGQILEMYWKYLGIYKKLNLVPYNKNRFHKLVFPGLEIELPSSLKNLGIKLSVIFPGEKEIINTFINKVKELKTYFIYFNRNHKGNLEKEHESFTLTANEYLDSLGASKELKAVLMAHSFLYGVPPSKAPLGTHSIFFNALYSSAYDIDGGGDALSKALVDSFLENGGEILFKKQVIRIDAKDKKVKGVETSDGTYFEADSVIANNNPKEAIKLINENVFRKIYINRINEMNDTCSHFGLYMVCGKELKEYNYDILYFPDYNIDSIYEKPVSGFPDDFFIYLTIPTARLGTSENSHIIETLSIDNWNNYSSWCDTKMGKRPADYYEFKDKIKNKIIDKIDNKIIKIKNELSFTEASTPLTNYHYTSSPKGSMYGIEHNIEQMRAPVRARTKLNNFYFTGQSLIFPGIVGVTITGFVTCSDILGQKYLFKRIDENI